jgi:SPP1 family predicted phage head-tail adaptor
MAMSFARTGEMRHRITIQATTPTRTAKGAVVDSWSTAWTRWAKIEPLSGNELEIASKVSAEVTHEVTFRYLSGMTAEHRIVYGSRTFNVLSVRNEQERDRRTVCMCTEVL